MLIIADGQLSLKRYFIILQCCSDDRLPADGFFKLPALYRLLCPDEQDDGTVGQAQHIVDFVDVNIAVLPHAKNRSACPHDRRFRKTAIQKTASINAGTVMQSQ